MSARRCPRVWQAQAVEDQRLDGSDRASFQRHAATCADCAREVAALGELRLALHQLGPAPPTALELRRLRATLLQSAHERRRQPTGRVWAALAAALGALALVAWAVLAPLRNTHGARVAGPVFEIRSVDHAIVTSQSEHGVARASLTSGAAAFHVQRLTPAERFFLTLPDGEIEVRGTRFVVTVRGGHTDRVEVSEGLVMLKLRGDADRFLGAGQEWERPISPPPAESLASTEAVSAPQAPSPGGPAVRAPRPASAPASAIAPRLPPPLSPRRRLADERFAAAMSALGAGHDERADVLFESFVRDFADDGRAEDASFLSAVACSRAGDAHRAAVLARDYLRTYRQGLRRREAEILAQERIP
jgi:hypothetical protein